jgi:predicted GNAT superfamily acetyltransferase
VSSQPETPGRVSAARQATPQGVEILELHGIDQAREVERLQTEIWRSDAEWVVPSHALLIVSDYGGILLGARLEGTLVGFVLGFLARSEDRLFHASHMLGVIPAIQQHGIGAALKWRQREVALQQGLDLMRWTFDPLESRNAYFNLHKLGAECRVYREDYYGPMQDDLNRDLPSDRLMVEWHLRDVPWKPDSAVPAQIILRDQGGSPQLQTNGIVADLPIAIEVPRDIQAIKHEAPDLALAWRLAVREAFAVSLGKGYRASDFRDGAYILLP